jgi:hypothetical protein
MDWSLGFFLTLRISCSLGIWAFFWWGFAFTITFLHIHNSSLLHDLVFCSRLGEESAIDYYYHMRRPCMHQKQGTGYLDASKQAFKTWKCRVINNAILVQSSALWPLRLASALAREAVRCAYMYIVLGSRPLRYGLIRCGSF